MPEHHLPGVAIFGTGPTTSIVVPHLAAAGFKLEAVWGKTSEEAEACADRHAIPFATNRADDALLRDDVDLAVVLCPPSLRCHVAVKALGSGKHVVAEPPVAILRSETLRQVLAARHHPTLTSVAMYGLRFVPAFAKLRQLVRDGLIGAVMLCDVRIAAPDLVDPEEDGHSWRCDGHAGGGGILNLFGGHVVDLLRHVTGASARRVHGNLLTLATTSRRIDGGIRRIDADDSATFQMECEDGSVATVSLNGACFATSFRQEISLRGTKGQLVVREGGRLIHRFAKGASITEEVILDDDDDELASSPPARRMPSVYGRGAASTFRHLADKFRETTTTTGGWPFATFQDALYVQAVVEAIRNSSRDKKWTKVMSPNDGEAADPSSSSSDVGHHQPFHGSAIF